jgi:hypothetical protein
MIALNALWFAIFPVPTFLCFRLLPLADATRIAVTLLIGLLTYSYAGAGVFALTARLARREEIRLKQFFSEGWRYLPRMLALSLVFGFVFFLLFQSVRFYGAIKVGGGVLGFFLAGIQIWLWAFCLLMQVYLLPLLFGRDWGLRQAIKWSAMLVVLRPGFTVLMFLQALGLSVILAVTGIGLVVLLYSCLSLFLSITLREVLREIEVKWTPKRKPTSWLEIFTDEDEDEEDKRTLGEILRPWD